jgi:hypothetical protein
VRTRSSELDPDSPPSGPFVYNSVAKLLEGLGHSMAQHGQLPHDVVRAASEIARHIRTYRGDAASD